MTEGRDGSNKDSSTKSRTLTSSNTEVVGIKKIQNDTGHITSQKVKIHNTGVRVSDYTLQYSVESYIVYL